VVNNSLPAEVAKSISHAAEHQMPKIPRRGDLRLTMKINRRSKLHYTMMILLHQFKEAAEEVMAQEAGKEEATNRDSSTI
jgi:hypothetical protein